LGAADVGAATGAAVGFGAAVGAGAGAAHATRKIAKQIITTEFFIVLGPLLTALRSDL
jgi:hypothetical protein